MKILLFGKNGQVGWELHRSLLPLGDVIAFGSEQVDFTKPESIRAVVQRIKPDIIINAAAYTAVDKAEEEKQLAFLVNSISPRVLAEEALKLNALLVHYSTDYIFDGTKSGLYVESDTPNPLNAYGESKLEGEISVQSSGCRYLILRTSWVYASRGNNFLRTILKLADLKDELKIVNDQYGSPTWARYIADATVQIINSKVVEGRGGFEGAEIFHLTNQGSCSWFEFANEIVSIRSCLDECKKTDVIAINSDQYDFVAKRPKDTRLSIRHFEEVTPLSNIKWEQALFLCMSDIYCNFGAK